MNWNYHIDLDHKTADDLSIQQITELLLEARGIITPEEKESFFHPLEPNKLSLKDLGLNPKAIKTAISRINTAIQEKQTVVIYGDYDADGICATAVLWHALAQLGLAAIPFIPHREKHGYGLSKLGIDDILEKNKPDLLITVDNGVVAHEAAEYLAEEKIDLIITDHHQTDGRLPKALSVVHSDQICGTAVAWIVARELLDTHQLQGAADDLLDLVSIGTIADMMPMIGVNRSFAKFGLKTLSQSTRPGILAMKRESGIDPGTELTTYHVGFVLGPRINAMGRIDHGKEALRLLCTNDINRADELASKLGGVNKDRQDITQESVDRAFEIYESDKSYQDKHIIVIADESFHEGVVGLVAGKLVEKYHKPAIVIAMGNERGKGSARSISGVNLIELIRSVEQYLLGAGGHPGAAGLSVSKDTYQEFKEAIENKSQEVIKQSQLEKTFDVDMKLPLSLVSFELQEALEQFLPFGLANPRPIFASDVEVVDYRLIGRERTHLKMTVSHPKSEGIFVDSIGFSMYESLEVIEASTDQTIAYTIDKNEWKGKVNLQLIIKAIKK